jgi:phenylalanyl-tRNA synthetase beta chain
MIDKSVSYEQLYQIASKNCTNLLKEVNLFDVYEGQNIEQGKKSYALSFILQSADKTLTDDEINAIMDKLIKAFEKEAGAVIRM